MAILQTIRTKASWLLIGALGLALFAFIFTDLFTSGNTFFNKFKDRVFSVNGESVNGQEFFERVADYEVYEKARRRVSNLDETLSLQIRESVYQQMASEMMLNSEAEKLGLAVNEEEIYQMTYGDMISPVLLQSQFFADPQTRQFDRDRLNGFLANVAMEINPEQVGAQQYEELVAQKTIWKVLRRMMVNNALGEKYTALLGSALSLNNTEAKATYDDSKTTADIAYVVERYTAIPDSTIKVEDSEIKALYNLRKENFKLDTKMLKVSYFYTEIVPSEEDYAEVEKEINKVHEELKTSATPIQDAKNISPDWNVDAFISMNEISQIGLPAEGRTFVETASVGDIFGPKRENQAFVMLKVVDKTVAPDSVKLQIIPLQAMGVIGDAATAKADSLISVIKGGKDFATVANEIMPGSNGGEWGKFTEAALSGANIAKECFAAATGDLLKLNLNGQQVLVRVQEKSSPVSKVKLAIVNMPVAVSDRTQSGVDNELNEFISNSGNLENFDKAAVEKGYNIISNQTISAADMSLGQIQNSRPVINWGFNEAIGAVKKFDISTTRVVAIVKEKIDSEYMPISELSGELRAEIIRDKKAEKMIADLKAKNLTSLDAYAQAVSGRVDTAKFVTFQTQSIGGIGYEPILNVYSKIGQPNQLSAPVKGQNGVYTLSVINKTDDTKEFKAEDYKQAQGRSIYAQMRYQAIYALREKMEVVDNRVAYY